MAVMLWSRVVIGDKLFASMAGECYVQPADQIADTKPADGELSNLKSGMSTRSYDYGVF